MRVLMLGASYGSLLASKLLLAGHSVSLVCLQAEAELINQEGFRVRFPVRGTGDLLEVDSRRLPGKLSAGVPQSVDPAGFDLVGLAMQEPQYRSPGVHELLDAVARARIPCMSIMNMPPLPYLSRLPGVSARTHRHCYTDPAVWDNFDPALMTLCSPDPQAFRRPEEKINVLQVGLPTNFKAARFDSDDHTAMLRRLQSDIERSRSIYEWVAALCTALGAATEDRVPFEKYATAASSLGKPSSAARAVAGGATHVERVDRLVQSVAAQQGMRFDAIDEIIATVDARIAANRRPAAH